MKPIPKINPANAVERCNGFNRSLAAVASRITLRFNGRIYRGHFTLAGRYLVVTCGSVSAVVEMGSGHLELQARDALLDLAKAGKLRQFAAME